MDGGICSQMHQYLLGCLFKERGYHVEYDLFFFKSNGKDMTGNFVRNFDLIKLFPDLDLKIAHRIESIAYRTLFYNDGNYENWTPGDYSFLELSSPIYLGGFYHSPLNLWTNLFGKYYKNNLSALDSVNMNLCRQIVQKANSVAVHVRRGDLSVETSAYGMPASITYFKKSIEYIHQKVDTPFFYFFSDEPSWVKTNLVPQLRDIGDNFDVVDINGSDKGYMDLLLIANCKHQITSKGSLGKFGALLMDNLEKHVVLCDDSVEYVWKDRLKNPIFL
ncbi:alpha-1,2-fucosyltransferase [Bacteroides sp.]